MSISCAVGTGNGVQHGDGSNEEDRVSDSDFNGIISADSIFFFSLNFFFHFLVEIEVLMASSVQVVFYFICFV